MLVRKKSLSILSLLGLTLMGCEGTNPHETLTVAAPMSSLKKNRTVQPQVAHAFLLLQQEKYSEASTYINQMLQTQPKSVIFHALNALTYEKMASLGDMTGIELAIVGYQNVINLDPFNVFAISQLGKLKYREQQYEDAQEHFANALLIKPNDPDLIHEFAAASYYAYDIKSAVSAIEKAVKLKPEDPLVQRSAAMMYAAVGDFKKAEEHFNFFQAKLGDDPEVDRVASRFSDWQSIYKSGRLILAADTKDVKKDVKKPEPAPMTKDSKTAGDGGKGSGSGGAGGTGKPSTDTTSGAGSGGGDTTSTDTTSGGSGGAATTSGDTTSGGSGGAATTSTDTTSGGSGGGDDLTVDTPFGSESDQPTQDEFTRGDIGQNILDAPVAGSLPKGPEAPTATQIIMDCYILEITEDAGTLKGNNILENLAVTLNPGSFLKFKGSMWGSGVVPATSGNQDNLLYTPDSGFGTFFDKTGKTVNTLTNSTTNVKLNSAGSITGRIFTQGLSWAGLSYNLYIANSSDQRVEIVSRPTLMTYLNKESKFFSGTELVNVSAGTYGSNLSRYPVGVSLAVKPDSLTGDLLTLSISVESSLLKSPDANLLQTVDVSKTRVDTTARIRLGETIMLGGIYERTEVDRKQGFPGLRDLPIIQYFFSKEETLSTRHSVMILLTPRSPDAVKSAVNRAMTRESVKPHLSELVSRNPDWFNPETNAINIFSYLNRDPILYYEFRTGDVLPPSWDYDVVLSDKLAELSSFLYY